MSVMKKLEAMKAEFVSNTAIATVDDVRCVVARLDGDEFVLTPEGEEGVKALPTKAPKKSKSDD